MRCRTLPSGGIEAAGCAGCVSETKCLKQEVITRILGWGGGESKNKLETKFIEPWSICILA